MSRKHFQNICYKGFGVITAVLYSKVRKYGVHTLTDAVHVIKLVKLCSHVFQGNPNNFTHYSRLPLVLNITRKNLSSMYALEMKIH